MLSDESPEHDLKTSLDHLTNQLLQTRFQMDEASRAALRAASVLRQTLVICAAVLSLVVVAHLAASFLPVFAPAASAGRSWVLWRQVGGTWDPLNAWPTKEACEAMPPKSRQVELAYRCLPDSVDPRGPKGN